uniref:Uncharacterized protein n=1 Tax=Nothobranchius furzeri TaxID=105023 RepID=A0A8C6Q955_NOTFU
MGFSLSKSMDANMTKQQEFMLHNSRLQVNQVTLTVVNLSEMIMLQDFIILSFSAAALQVLSMSKMCVNQVLCQLKVAPIFPLIAYAVFRPREAENIMTSEQDRLDQPHSTPTFESIEKARRAKSSLASLLEK